MHRRAHIFAALTCVAVVGATAAVLSASAPALAATTNQIGPGGGTSAQTSCPSGTWAVGFEITTNNTPNNDPNAVTNYTRGVQLLCSDGSTSPYVGGALPAPSGHTTATGPSSCLAGDAVVGIYGRNGAIVDGLGAMCATTAASAPYAAAYVGRPVNNPEGVGAVAGPYDCAGSRLTGLQITYESFLNEDTLSSVTGICETNTITFTTPSNGTYGGSDTLTVSTTEGTFAPATIASGSPSVCTVSGVVVTYVGYGTCELTASAPGAANVVKDIAVKADTTTTLTASGPSASVNQPVTFTATVAPVAPATTTPTGTVSFYIDGSATPAATVALVNGVATFTTSFGAGQHTVVAVYNGSTLYNGSTSATSAPVTVGCTQTITGTHSSVIASSGTVCLVNATIKGSVVVGSGASLDVENSTVTGSITDGHAAAVRICGSTIGGSVAVSAATGYVRVGDPAGNCVPNTINNNLTARDNTGGGTISGNTIGGSVVITTNTPAFTVAGNHH